MSASTTAGATASASLTRTERTFSVLNVRSATASAVDERTAQARIRDAAVVRFAADGFGATTIRAIAAEAGVSPGLVIHHYRSKEGLREACDRYVLDVVSEKFAALEEGGSTLESWASLVDERLPLVAYVGRALAEGGDAAAALMDTIVTMSEQTLADWERTGRVRPSADPHARAVVLVAWDLSLVVLAEQIRRSSGIDPLDRDGLARLSLAASEVYAHGLFTEGPWVDEVPRILDAMTSTPSPDTSEESDP